MIAGNSKEENISVEHNDNSNKAIKAMESVPLRRSKRTQFLLIGSIDW